MATAEPIEALRTRWRVQKSLRGLQDALAVDHFALELVSNDERSVRISISALEGACADCLISQSLLAGLVRTQIPSDLNDLEIDIDLNLPEGWVCEP